jgi:hypothetical protein
MNPAVAVLLVVLCLLLLLLPRKYAVIPLLSGLFLIWLGSQLYVAGVHWLALRLLILTGLLRIAISKPQDQGARSKLGGGFSKMDKAFLTCVLIQAVCVMLLFQQMDAVVNQFGFLVDFLGGYFLLRFLIQDESDIYRALKCLACLSLILAAGMIMEQIQLKNYFAQFAGVVRGPDIREGKIRSQGVFQHAIPAGTVGATWIPLFFLLWRNGKSKIFAMLGLAGATIMTYTSQSSTPLLAFAASFLGLGCWFIRDNMRKVRWAIVLAILVLAMVMKAPLWFLIAHIDLTGGSSGYHRAELIDQFIRHFGDWWLIGVKDTSQWGFDLWDVQNQFVNVGESGGLLAFCFFIALVTHAFVRIGNARKAIAGNKDQEWLVWFLGCALFSNVLAFIGVNYYDQSKMSWFLILSFICAATAPMLKNDSEKKVAGELVSSRDKFSAEGKTEVVSTRSTGLRERYTLR